jgi:hypothetical protein
MLRGWPRFAEILFQQSARESDHIFHLWGHSWEIEATNMWRHLDSFLGFASGFDCRFETNCGSQSGGRHSPAPGVSLGAQTAGSHAGS